MVSIVRILLLSVCAATLVRGQTSVCYSSLDCHGNILDVVLPEKSEASLFPSECCSCAARGLSYRQSEGEPCANCYTDDNFEGYGNKFYLALFGNFQPQTSFDRIGKVRLSVSPVTEEVSSFTVERQGKETKYTAPTEVEYKSEDVNLDSIKTRDQSIIIRSENGDELSVVAFAEEYSSSDTFRVMPCVRLPDVGYEYYAVSVPKASLKLEFGDLDIIADVEGKSTIVIVTTEDNTYVSITLTQDITNVDANDIMSQIGGGDTLSAGVEYTFKLSQSKQTLYLASEDDLTGSRVVSSKPIAFISGHECGTVPFNIFYCDQLVEQLPPSATWGKRFISAPIEGRSAVDVFRVVASRDNTILESSCFQGNNINITLNAGEFREFNMSSSSYCYYESNEPLLMVQFSVASDLDNVLAGDPFMVVVPPVEQYRNSYNISTFNSSDETNLGTNYINILFPASESGSPQDILFDGQNLSSSVQFVEIPCDFNGTVCAYAAQMNTTAVPHVLSTSDPSVVVNAIVYWLSFRVGHGYFAGMTQDPIALPMISLDQEEYEEHENNTLVITIVRSGDFARPITVYLTSIQVTRDNAALVDVDFVARTEEVLVSERSTVVSMEFIDDVFPEGDEQFEVFLSAAPGALVVSPAYATVTILNEDPPLPVMNISFVATNIDVIEGAGVIKLVLKKTEGAIGPVSVRIYTEEGTAIEGEDFIGVNDTLTFGVDETEMEVLVFILDNSALEELEQFTVKIKAIDGIYPVAVTNSTATVLVDDNDVVVLGFSQVDFTTSENVGGVGVRVEVMVGQLERSVAVWVNSTQQSTATPGQDFERVSRLLTFDSERNSGVVGFGIFDDVEREVAIETVNLQLSFVEEEVNSKIRLLPNQMVVSIMDDDAVEVGMLPVRGTVREGEGSARVNISILQGTLGNLPISFIVSTANGTAQANTDYEQREEVVTLSELNPFEELIFPVMDDSEYEGRSNEIFFVQAQLDPNGQNSERVKIASDLARTPITIIDNEVRPFASIGFIQRTWTVSEGAGEVVLLLESDGRNVEPVEVTYSFQNGSETAEVGLDYLNGGGVGTLLFPPGTTVVTVITVAIMDDESAESTEFFTVSLFPGQDVTLTADQATVYIEDNDAVEAQLSMTRYTISEAAASVEVVVQISTATETVQLNISTVNGTALAGVDYVQREVQLTFSPGDFERSVTIQVINDRIQEDTELFFVTLHSPVSNLKVELPQANTSVFVIDDDKVGDPLEPSLSVVSTSTTSASLVWTQDPIQPVTRFFLSWTYTGPCDPQPPQSVIIGGEERSYTIMDLEEGANYTFGLTAINGIGTSRENMVTGYTLPAAPSGSPRNIQATEITESSVVIQWEEIDCLDQNEIIVRYEITLNGSLLSSADPGQFTSSILNLSPETSYIITVTGVNEAGNGPASTITIRTAGRPEVIIGFNQTRYDVSEDDGQIMVYVVVLQGSLQRQVVVNVLTVDNTTLAGSDYTAVGPTSLTFDTNNVQFAISIDIVDDEIQELDENFFVFLTTSDDNVILDPGHTTVQITRDLATTQLGFDSLVYSVTEGSVAMLGMVLDMPLTVDITVTLQTNEGTATDPEDYRGVMSVITFTAGQTRKLVNVNITDDRISESSEFFTATLSNASPSSRVEISQRLATVNIVDVSFGDALQGSCRGSVNCDGSPGDILIPVTTIENCCLNTPAGLAFNVGESCTPCIVFGFFQDSFTGIEQGQSHVVQAGWQKGAAQAGVNLQFNVINTGITAREGVAFDYTISTGLVRFLYRSPNPSSVVCIFHKDSIAQEIRETLKVGLVRAPGTTALPTGDHVFFRNTLNVTIIDSDVVDISFTEDSYRANEKSITDPTETSFMPVRVVKTSRIANPIVLDVIPLTVDMARANSPPALPDNIPVNNPFSPPFADLNDFDSTAIRITFDPDEDANNKERAAPIPIIDDLVNEADEQIFIVQLRLINSINSSAIDFTTRATSLCRIIDDDSIIRIGFEVAQYTYIEPMFDTSIDEFDYIPPTNLPENGPIYLVKQDNVVSEQTFLVVITITDTVPSGSGLRQAQFNSDYGGIGSTPKRTSVIRQFPAAAQRMQFPFTLLNDDIAEGNEAFLVSTSAEDEGIVNGITYQVPGFLSPTTLFPQAYVIIIDDDPIIIGFEVTEYTVDESVGVLDVYVSVSNPPMNMELVASVQLVIQSISINANGGDDYVEINADNFDVFLTFDDLNRRLTFEVTIIDDDLFESVEDFNLELRYDPFLPVPSRVVLRPNVSSVYILDDDSNGL